MEEIPSTRSSDTSVPHMLAEKLGKAPVYDSAQTLQQISLLSMSSLDNLHFDEELAQALLDLDFESCDSLLAHQPVIEGCKNATDHRIDISHLYSKLVDKLLCLFDTVEVACGKLLGSIIARLVVFAVKRDVEFSQAQLTRVVTKLYESDRENAMEVLDGVSESKWSEEMHSIKYKIEWESSKKEVKMAETRIQSVSMELEFASKQGDKASVLDQQRQLLECALQKNDNKLSQQELRNKHWLSLRIRFEYAWRHFVESKATTSVKEQPLSPEIQSMGAHLLYSIMVLTIHFEEYEYAWYWSERREIDVDFSVLVVLMRCCRAAIKTGDKSLWSGRAWVLYKDCLTFDDDKWSEHDFEYVLFMNEVIQCLLVYSIYKRERIFGKWNEDSAKNLQRYVQTMQLVLLSNHRCRFIAID